MSPRILTVLVNYRTAELTLHAVEALMNATAALPGIRAVVVDNLSEDGSLARLREGVARRGFGQRVDVLDAGRNGGFGAGCNVGIRFGLRLPEQFDYFYMLNSDAFVDDRTIPELVGFLQAHPRAGIAGSSCWDEATGDRSMAFRFPSLASELESAVRAGPLTALLRSRTATMPLTQEPTRCDWVTGASLMLRREVIERVGMFDESFFLYFEETDLCRRARDAGFEVWLVPASRVMHAGGASTGTATARLSPYWFASRRHYLLKHHGRTYAAGADAVRVAGHVLHRLYRRLTGRPSGDPPHFLRDLLGAGK